MGSGRSAEEVAPFWRVVDPKSPLAGKLSCGRSFVEAKRKQEKEQEVPFEFPHPITIGRRVYHNTDELEKGENINLGSIMNTEDG